jgi:hypothetical protein
MPPACAHDATYTGKPLAEVEDDLERRLVDDRLLDSATA